MQPSQVSGGIQPQIQQQPLNMSYQPPLSVYNNSASMLAQQMTAAGSSLVSSVTQPNAIPQQPQYAFQGSMYQQQQAYGAVISTSQTFTQSSQQPVYYSTCFSNYPQQQNPSAYPYQNNQYFAGGYPGYMQQQHMTPSVPVPQIPPRPESSTSTDANGSQFATLTTTPVVMPPQYYAAPYAQQSQAYAGYPPSYYAHQ